MASHRPRKNMVFRGALKRNAILKHTAESSDWKKYIHTA